MMLYNTFIIYLIIFRLSIILVGLASIILGYKLFLKGVFAGEKQGRHGVAFEASIASNKISLKNAAPGTMFALFGVILISVMVINGSPELLKENIEAPINGKVILRSSDDGTEKLKAMMQEVVNTQMAKGGALNFLFEKKEHEKALMSIANHLNTLAWSYKEQNRLEDALAMSKLAVSFSPNESNFLDTLAEIYFELKMYDLAVKCMEKAYSFDESKKGRLKELKKVLSDSKR